MRKEKGIKKSRKSGTRLIIPVGIAVVVISFVSMAFYEKTVYDRFASRAVTTLRRQCSDYDDLLSADKTKSLFRLADSVKVLKNLINEDENNVNEEYLSNLISEMRVTGVIVTDSELHSRISINTGDLEISSIISGIGKSNIGNALKNESGIILRHVEIESSEYDVAITKTIDTDGIIIGFYKQSAKGVELLKTELSSLFNGLHMNYHGMFYVIGNDELLATNDAATNGDNYTDNEYIENLCKKDSDAGFFFKAGHQLCYGMTAEYGTYRILIYFPLGIFKSNTFLVTIIALLAYISLMSVFYSWKNRIIIQKQHELEKTNKSLRETINILRSFESIYFTGVYVDVEHNRYESLFAATWLKDGIPENGDFSSMVEGLIENYVAEEDRQVLRDRINFESIRERLREDKLNEFSNSFYVDYKALRQETEEWCRVTVIPIDFSEGYPLHVLVMLQDINDEKSREQQYQDRILEEAELAKKANVAKTEFLRRISHDIRTPINGIQGMLSIAEHCADDKEKQAYYRRKIYESSGYLLELVNSVLDMSKLETGEICLEHRPLRICDVMEEINTIVSAQAVASDIDYENVSEDTDADDFIMGSSLHIKQILLNVAGNAVKYGKKGGYVRLKSRVVEKNDNRVYYEFVCEDNGQGMSEEFQSHMFEPFMQENETARTAYHGTGLGLSIVKRLVDMMDGTIIVNSVKNEGTKVTIRLGFDRYIQMKKPEDAVSGEKNGISIKGMNVLIAEDNEINREIMIFFAEYNGAVPYAVNNGLEAFNAFKNSETGFFDLILMDIMMPEMNGLEASEKIRSLNRPDAVEIPIIAMSANAFSDDIERSRNAGMDNHVPKPVNKQVLMEVISEAFKKRGRGKY